MTNPHLSDNLELTLDRFAAMAPQLMKTPLRALLSELKVFWLAGAKVLADEKAYDVEGVKRWITEFQDASFRAENILEDILEEVLDPRTISEEVLEPGALERFWDAIRNFNKDKRPLQYHRTLQEKMDGVVTLLGYLVNQINEIGLRDRGGSVERQGNTRSHMTPLYQDRYFEQEALSRLLLSPPNMDKDPTVISVIGTPGIGKTALVDVVYNDEKLTSDYDLKVWIHVGQDFDILRVTKDVLHKITSAAVKTEDLFSLQVQLRNTVRRKRFLLVLDDFWSDSSRNWNRFLSALTDVSENITIVLTTQSDIVGSVTTKAETCRLRLRLMTDAECWELICSFVFGDKSAHSIDQELENTGKRIAGQCMGLPLAATTIASHLRSKPGLKEWNDVSDNFLYYTSYDSLPCHLKRCFAYCSIFPKGYKFDRKNLVLLWMAVDLLYQPGSDQRLEDIGSKYLDELVAKSLLQRLDDKKTFIMNDLMNELAKTAAGEFCFRLEDDSSVQIPERVRHLSFSGKQWDTSVASTFTHGAEYLRTFLPLPRVGSSELEEKKALHPLPHFSEQALRCLRILSLSHYHITKLPISFEVLKQLRYLDLSNTEVEEIPEFVFSLRNLQTLFLSNCRQLRRLTAYITKLISLRYLDLLGTPLVEMPQGISNLRSLQNLSNFVIGNLSGAGLQELRELSHLRGKLHISELQNVVSVGEASDPDLKNKRFLKNLVLTWRVETSDSNIIACDQREVLQMLQPHHNLETVSINSYGGETFPNWLGGTSFSSMTSVSLTSCSRCILLPPLGQLLHLRDLSIEKFKKLKKVGLEFFYGENDNLYSLEPFSNLQTLSFFDMPTWEDWHCPASSLSKSRIFPRLTKLTIRSCPSLKNFPKKLLEFTQDTNISDSALRCEEDYCKISQPSSSEKKELHSDAGSTSVEMIPQQDQDDMSIKSFEDDTSMKSFEDDTSLEDDTSFESYKVTKDHELLSESLKTVNRLHIACPKLDYLPPTLLQDFPNLQELLLVDCHSLEAFPVEYPSTTLKTLYITDCMKLEFIKGVEAMFMFPQLEDLFIDRSCRTLSSFPLVLYPNLKSLSIRHCEQLSSLTTVTSASDDAPLLSLEALEITDCQKLECFPKRGLQTLKLTSLLISNCGSLKALPAKIHTLTSLESIHINDCPKLEANRDLEFWCFPESLTTLCISHCQKLKPKVGWCMTKFHNVRDLEIEGGNDDVVSFPEKDLLPFSLYSLRISKFKNLRTLDNRGLEDLPKLGILEISGCDKLASVPEEGLPPSLSLLRINGSPILKEKILRKKMEWFKIKDIQLVEIDGEQLTPSWKEEY